MRFTTATIIFAAAVLGGTQVLANGNEEATAVEAREADNVAPVEVEAREPLEATEVDLEARRGGFGGGARGRGFGGRSRSRSVGRRRRFRAAGAAAQGGAAAAEEAREFFDDADELEARFIKKLWRKIRGKKKAPAQEEYEARDFDDELEERDFDDLLEERDFDDFEDLEVRRFAGGGGFKGGRGGFRRAGGRAGGHRRPGGHRRAGLRGLGRGARRFGGAAAGAAAEAAAPAEAREFFDDDELVGRDFDDFEDLEARRFAAGGGGFRGGARPGGRLPGIHRNRIQALARARRHRAAAAAERREFIDDDELEARDFDDVDELEARRFGAARGIAGAGLRRRPGGAFRRPGARAGFRGIRRFGRKHAGAAAEAAAPAERREFIDDDLYERYFGDFDIDEIDA